MQEQLSADYVLQLAEQIERNGQRFYFSAAQRYPEARGMFLLLGQMEVDHQETFAHMRSALAAKEAQEIDPNGDLAHYIRSLADGTFFDPSADPSSTFGKDDPTRSVIETAIGLERQSILFYEGLVRLLSDPADRKTVETIITSEIGHIGLLAKFLQGATGGRPLSPAWEDVPQSNKG